MLLACSSALDDSAASTGATLEELNEEQSRLTLQPAGPCLPSRKRRREEDEQTCLRAGEARGQCLGQATVAVPAPRAAGPGEGAADVAAAFAPLALSCSESLPAEDADCSSVATDEGFVVYQSPVSVAGAQADKPRAAAVPASCSLPRPVLAEQLPPRLAGDPDLAEMLSVLCDKEAQLQPGCAYLDQHGPAASPDLYLDASMRRTVASWLVEVATEFGLHQETLFLAVALLDRFLAASKGVPRTQLQLVAVACMLVATKHEEEMHPSVVDFTNIADNCFTPGDLLRMEAIVLDCLSFRVNTPTAHTFLSMYKQALGLQPRTCALASYLSELAMLEYDLLAFRPSHVAAAATLLAQLYTGDTQSLSHLPSVARYTFDQLRPCLRRLLALQRAAHTARDYSSPYLAVLDKCRGSTWLCVGCITPFASSMAMGAALDSAVAALPIQAARPAGDGRRETKACGAGGSSSGGGGGG